MVNAALQAYCICGSKKNDESYEDLYKTWISRLDPWSTDPVIHNPLSANPTKWLNTLKQLVG